MSGDKVWDAYLDGQIDAIRNYCETDVLNTFLIYLRFELMRGMLSREEFAAESERVRETLRAQPKPHFEEFLAAWQGLAILKGTVARQRRGSGRAGAISSICRTTAAEWPIVAGKAVFIDDALPGERVEWSRLKRGRNFDEGRLERILRGLAGSRGATLRTLRRLRRLRSAAPLRRSARSSSSSGS